MATESKYPNTLCNKVQNIIQKWAIERKDANDIDSLQKLSEKCDVNLVYVDPSHGGKINHMLRASLNENSKSTLILKTGPSYVKNHGSTVDLDIKRRQIEYEFMETVHSMGHHFLPLPYFLDESTYTECIEDLREYRVLKYDIIKGDINITTIKKIAECLGVLHQSTQDLSPVKAQKFQNLKVLNRLADLFFTNPYIKDEETNIVAPKVLSVAKRRVYENCNLLQKVDKFKTKYLQDKECLIHGDFHTGNVMINEDEIKMIDFEFAHVGPCAVDITYFLAPLMAAYHQHMLTPQNNDWHRRVAFKILDSCKSFVNTYLEKTAFTKESRKNYINELISDVAGFVGCELISRTIGIDHFQDLQDNPSAEVECLETGVRLLNAHERIHDMNMLLNVAFMLT